jgi:hypothetical protein
MIKPTRQAYDIQACDEELRFFLLLKHTNIILFALPQEKLQGWY